MVYAAVAGAGVAAGSSTVFVASGSGSVTAGAAGVAGVR